MKSDRDALAILTRLVIEEIVFLDKGYGEDKPEGVKKEYDALQAALNWLHFKTEELNRKEYQDGN